LKFTELVTPMEIHLWPKFQLNTARGRYFSSALMVPFLPRPITASAKIAFWSHWYSKRCSIFLKFGTGVS